MNDQNTSPVKQVRKAAGNAAKQRRNIGLLGTIGILAFIPISLYQVGILKHLPDLPGDIFDSDFVNASKDAKLTGIPDGPVSLLMYAANLVLISSALKKKKKRNIFDYLIAGNALGQAVGGGYYLYNMATKEKKICPYCIAGAAINFITLWPLYRLFKKKLCR